MTTKWARLLNAEHIDRILASSTTGHLIWELDFSLHWRAAWDTARAEISAMGRDEAWDTARRVAPFSMLDPIAALMAYDDCAYLLDCEPDELRLLSKLGDDRAILLLPACIAFNKIKELA